MYKIECYANAEDYIFNNKIVEEFNIPVSFWSIDKIERFMEWYMDTTGNIAIVRWIEE